MTKLGPLLPADEPSSVLTVLGTAAPQTAIFFMTYLLLQVCVGGWRGGSPVRVGACVVVVVVGRGGLIHQHCLDIAPAAPQSVSARLVLLCPRRQRAAPLFPPPQVLLSKPLSLLRLGDLVKWWLRSGLAPTARARARLWQEQTLQYGTLVPDDTIAMLLGLVSC